MKKSLILLFTIGLLCLSTLLQAHQNLIKKPEVQAYINDLVKTYHFERDALEKLFTTVTISQEVITKLSTPTEAKPWYEYYKLVVTQEKVDKGVEYWHNHEKTLRLAEKKYGVPASIIVAIIGVETKFGENKGNHPVFNTLATLAFNDGRRANFFRSELTQYLLLTRENNLNTLLLTGSYAGAVGLPQFMPSSYRNYAVDFYHKGFADLFNSHPDAIASVANYLKKHGWKKHQPIAIPATCETQSANLTYTGFKPTLTKEDLCERHIIPSEPLNSHKVALIKLKSSEKKDELWLGFQNFYTITTYNKSELYAMSVNLLAKRIYQQKHRQEQCNAPQPCVEKEIKTEECDCE